MFQFGTDNLFDFGVTGMAMEENDQEAKVHDMICFFGNDPTPKIEVDMYMRKAGINYDQLPQWLKDEIDYYIDVLI